MTNKTLSSVRKWFGLNRHWHVTLFFTPGEKLNDSDQCHSSLFLDLKRCKVPFGGELEPSVKLDTQSADFGVWSDWPNLNDIHVQSWVFLEWSCDSSERLMTDPLNNNSGNYRACLCHNDHSVSHSLRQCFNSMRTFWSLYANSCCSVFKHPAGQYPIK